ncbi:MAG: hypothetical protein A2402_02420 [Candidatus Staskawiczbacteria bacterium RIFOXYC1_FULL_37_43]|nr:MAG: hypothetical protein A2813_02400 [Candidatus Staskawiczbacteria bacterium RIFCSPHIGHO2_01_FULL_37_17]OGZ72493.1 MAG: hypothetical protein A2891_00320 [Candidatus Staskawiczbacteria bacterium RIFCSPLOWO2_01_FULL_37_19]OGZ75654.1 MAG: hypothetical protein A2205_00500 [Candidatus Staskawiczbacteria bacterium RIFOXYA1_FULL_37_15]OGZ77418.1 MAG: hypothetical protein A2280_02705 [Candidatus Staskawiczbacteria bacterium RIFOXYA12_FULL_37_10]OGZ79931.1 MAG: hypothetical protein A2353_01740 [Can
MKKLFEDFKGFLEKLDHYRDELLFLFIKPYWPKNFTPNKITWIRVGIGVVLFILLFFLGAEDKILVLSLFTIGVITDMLDGSVARGKDMVTEFGAMLDSTADRILIIPIAVYSLFSLHRWLLLILILIEVLNAFVSIFYKSKEIYLESNIFGKTKMVLQSAVFVVILIIWPSPPAQFFIYLLWATIPFSFLSMAARIIELKNKNKIKIEIPVEQKEMWDNMKKRIKK